MNYIKLFYYNDEEIKNRIRIYELIRITYTLPFIKHTLFILMGNSMHAILYEKRIFLLFISNFQINLFSYMISTEFNIWFAVQNLVIQNLKNRRALQSGFSNGPINYQRTLLIAMT